MGVGPLQSGGMEAVVWLPAKQQVRGSQPPPGACFMQISASESLLFLFSLTEGANFGRIWRSGQTRMLVTEWVRSVGMALPFFLSSLVRQPCCIVLESYLVHVPSYGGIIWLKQEEMETNF